jgi:hypothetical protein
VGKGSSIKFSSISGDRFLIIDKGTIYAEIDDEKGYAILDKENDKALLGRGKFEAGLRYTISISSGDVIPRKGKYQINFEDQPLSRVVRFLEDFTGKKIFYSSPILRKKRVNFYTDKMQPSEVIKDFATLLAKQGVEIVLVDEDTYKLIPCIKKGLFESARRLYLRVKDGSATLFGTKGIARVGSGEEAIVDADGFPYKRKAELSDIASWRYTLPSEKLLARRAVLLPPLEICYMGEDKDGRPKLGWRLIGKEFPMKIKNRLGSILISCESKKIARLEENKEIALPIKLLFKTEGR